MEGEEHPTHHGEVEPTEYRNTWLAKKRWILEGLLKRSVFTFKDVTGNTLLFLYCSLFFSEDDLKISKMCYLEGSALTLFFLKG